MSAVPSRFPTFTALAAVVRRDLTGSRRAAMLPWARGLAAASAAALTLFVYAESNAGARSIIGPGMVGSMGFGALGLVTLVLAPALAATTLRRERDAGTLDLLLMAGLNGRRLAAGRALSTFLLLGSLLTCLLPSLALLWFFRRMAPAELLACSAVYLAWCAVLAGAIVTISAWARSGAMAVVITLAAEAAWLVYQFTSAFETSPTRTTWLLRQAAQRAYFPLVDRDDLAFMLGLALHVALAGILVLVAARGIQRRTRARGPHARTHRILDTAPADRRWPVTWLLQREHPAIRPRAQLVALAVLCGIFLITALVAWRTTSLVGTLLRDPAPFAGLAGALVLLLAYILPLIAAAWPSPAMKEDHTWDSLLSTPLAARRLMTDLARSAALAGIVPFATGALLVLLGLALGGTPPGLTLVVMSSFVGAFALAVAVGLAASLAGRTSATSLALALAAPFVLLLPSLLLPYMSGAATVYRHAPISLYWGAPTWSLLGAAFIGGLALAATRHGPASAAFGVLLSAAAAQPLALAFLPVGVLETAAPGSLGALVNVVDVAMGERELETAGLLAGALWQALTAAALFAVLFSRAERMIGRPS